MTNFKFFPVLIKFSFIFSLTTILVNENSFAACGGTVRSWVGTTTTWTTAANWNAANVPDSASEDVVVVSRAANPNISANLTVGCVDVQSGVLNGTTNNRTLTVTGDYFQAPYPNSLNFTSNTSRIVMAGTANQTFEAVDSIRDLSITNTTQVTLKGDFIVASDFLLTGSGTTSIEGTVRVSGTAITIPSGHTVIVKSGAALYSHNNLTVNGTLRIEAGGVLKVFNGRTLQVNSSGTVQLVGSSGNPATIESDGAGRFYTFNMAGTLSANYFVITRTQATGLNTSGTISQLNNGEFRGIRNNGYAVTLTAAASIPTTLTSLGFFNDDGVGNPRNFSANAYTGAATTVNLYSGSVSGATFETDTGNKINWGTASPTYLTITNDAETGEPGTTIATSTTQTFAEFAFMLNRTDTATDVTQVLLTLTGTATTSDLASVKAYRDVNNNCDYNAGTDTQIGSDLVFSGSPAKATITIPAGVINPANATTQKCLLIVATTTANPTDQRTVRFGIMSASDVTNSAAYDMSPTSGTPIQTAFSTIVNTNYSIWDGSSSTAWNTAANWSGNTLPSSTRDCTIGTGINNPIVNTTPVSCYNATLQSNGVLNWNSSSNLFEVYGALDVGSNFNFQNATSGQISMRGATNQTLSLETAFPGNLIINNTGANGSNTISVLGNSTVNGNLTCTDGKISIANGVTLTIKGNITVQTGCELEVQAGGTLALGNNRTLTVNSGGTFTVLGNSGTPALVTSDLTTSSYNVVVNGTIKARYYIFDHLGTNGVSIEAGATIDATNYLQNGSFIYPVSSSTTLLKLKRQIPGNALANMNFDKNGSSASSITNIDTTGAGAGTLSITQFSGDVSGPSFDVDPSYTISWSGQTNSIEITQEATSPSPVTAGNTYIMGRFGFKQAQAGASYSDTNLSQIKLTLTGTGSASDVQSVKIYSDTSCSGSGGTLIGTTTFTGNPAKATFNLSGSTFVIPAALITTTKVCIYTEFDIASDATGGSTVGVSLASAADFTNSLSYSISASTPAPITLGTAATINAPSTTTWTGATNTTWTTAGNWTAGVPSATKNCTIPNTTNKPTIASGTVNCLNANITNGTVTLSAGANWDIYGSFSNTGTFNHTGNLRIVDGGVTSNHTVTSNSTLTNLHLNKTGGGNVFPDGANLTVTSLVLNNPDFNLTIASGSKLTLPNGLNLNQGALTINGGGTLEIGNTQTLTIAGGTFTVNGTNDSFPQSSSNKGLIQPQGGTGTWNFTATSGIVDISGFYFNRMGLNGLNIGGTTDVLNLRGGQFTNLSTSYASVKAIQLNTTGDIPVSASNIAWNWGAFNAFNPANGGTPQTTDNYQLISSTGCGGQSIDFTGWTGDWFESRATFNVATKVSASGCTINLGAASSAINITSFEAKAYDQKVDVRWQTNAEQNHLGYNIFRSSIAGGRLLQINQNLIRNLVSAASKKGKYRFIDEDVENGTTYYYYLEDVEISGKKTLHGPVSAYPQLGLGNPPSTSNDENSGSNPGSSLPNTGNDPVATNTGYQNLGDGIIVQYQTNKSLKLEINSEAPLFKTSTWNSAYQEVSINTHAKMTNPGFPELPEKEILISVNKLAGKAKLIGTQVLTTLYSNKKIAPAPSYELNDQGILVPSFSLNTEAYSQNAASPVQFALIQEDLIKSNQTYLRVKVTPLKFNPATGDIEHAHKIVLTINLESAAAGSTPTSGNLPAPHEIADAIKIKVKTAGMYQVNFTDLSFAGVDEPLKNINTDELRLFHMAKEIPLEVYSITGSFSAGDYIRFWAPVNSTLEDKYNELVLTSSEAMGLSSPPLRIKTQDANPEEGPSGTQQTVVFKKVLENNLTYVDSESLNDDGDHYFWASLFNYTGYDRLTTDIDLSGIDTESEQNVKVQVYLKGQRGYFDNDVKHHLSFMVGGNLEDEVVFTSNDRQAIKFEIPADRFISGVNSLALKVEGTYAPSGDYDRILIDRIEVEYRGQKQASLGQASFQISESGWVHKIINFANNQIHLYDHSSAYGPVKLTNYLIGNQNSKYFAEFMANSSDHNIQNYVALTTDSFLSPLSLSFTRGATKKLKDLDNQADFIVIGHENLLSAAEKLIDRRSDEGMQVMAITPEEIYEQFNHGQKSTSSVQNFINYALNRWQKAPKYVLFLGDGTIDPLDHNLNQLPLSRRAAAAVETQIMPTIVGRFLDFSSDNYFVSWTNSHMPRLATGRIPSNNPEEIQNYIDKVIAYEEGELAPDEGLRTSVFVADKDLGHYESFQSHVENMARTLSKTQNTILDRSKLGSDLATKNEVMAAFLQGPLFMSLMGHGAQDRFGQSILLNEDAEGLDNKVLPIVTMWNCETAFYYGPDLTERSLGEKLIFNKDGGAIAFLGSTTQTTPPAQAKLSLSFFNQLNQLIDSPHQNTTLGEVLLASKLSVGPGNYEKDIVNSFVLLGDPTLKLPKQLFNAQREIAGQEGKSGFFGCSAKAHDGRSATAWYWGAIEFGIFLFFLLYLRRLFS